MHFIIVYIHNSWSVLVKAVALIIIIKCTVENYFIIVIDSFVCFVINLLDNTSSNQNDLYPLKPKTKWNSYCKYP